MRRLREDAQRLLERPPRRVQICLRLRVLRVALRVELVAPCADACKSLSQPLRRIPPSTAILGERGPAREAERYTLQIAPCCSS